MAVELTNLLIDIENQRNFMSCGGQAASTYLEAIWKKFKGESVEFSAAFIWRMALKESGKTGNVGVSASSIFTVLQKYGCCPESDYPYTDENLNRDPPEDVIAKAKPYRIAEWKFVQWHEVTKWIDMGLPVFVNLQWIDNNPNSGHFVDVFGYDPTRKLIVNSWGGEWNGNGMVWMPTEEFAKKCRQGVVITRVDSLFKLVANKFKSLWKKK